jgi:hypothetical protein
MGGRKIGNQQQPERHKRIKSFQRFFELGVFEWRKEFFFFPPSQFHIISRRVASSSREENQIFLFGPIPVCNY